ncbi:MAG: glutamine amidotransferase family protein [Pseudomonadota bacterium]|nr:glutamine amidotransferase family protein [Pseudomonadota bacterium]
MCGIVGLFLKAEKLQSNLGKMVCPMLVGMGDRGRDSAGLAIYRNSTPPGTKKMTLHRATETQKWDELTTEIALALKITVSGVKAEDHFTLHTNSDTQDIQFWLKKNHPNIRVVSVGEKVEIYKKAGQPEDIISTYQLEAINGTHAIGHTRMATESAVTTQHSHPFSTGMDLCLVHNGSLSNHNQLRLKLQRYGIEFETDNDTEVAAGYITYRMTEGATLEEALEAALIDLDGFFTFAVGTRDGFAVLRDSVACKPAVMAETDDWVAMASEFRSIAHLPGAENAFIWEPVPATVYTWGNA